MLSSVDMVIERLGGLQGAAQVAGVGSTAVWNWKDRGRIPAIHYLPVKRALEALNAPEPDPALFGFKTENAA